MEFGRLKKSEMAILILHLIIFIITPHLPRNILILTDTIIVRVALLAILLYSVYLGPVTGIATFIVIAFLFIERNRIKMKHLETIMSQSTPESEAIMSIETPATAPEQPLFEIPEVESHPFMPQSDSGDDSFAPVAETINAKQPLPTEGSNDGVQKAISQLYEWVNPNLAQAPL